MDEGVELLVEVGEGPTVGVSVAVNVAVGGGVFVNVLVGVLVKVLVGVGEGVTGTVAVNVGVTVGTWRYVIHSCGRWLVRVASLLPNRASPFVPEERSRKPLLLKDPLNQPCVTAVTSISRYWFARLAVNVANAVF